MVAKAKKKSRIPVGNKKKKLDTVKDGPTIDDSGFKDELLKAHNECRRKHNVPPATWSNTIAESAQKWADTIARKGKFEHAKPNQRKGQGENIACASGEPMTGEAATKMWYDEVANYDFNSKPTYNPNCGHFTQVVWAESTEIGAGRATDKKGMHYVVVRYSPAGNNLNEFEQNIQPPVDNAASANPVSIAVNEDPVVPQSHADVCSTPEMNLEVLGEPTQTEEFEEKPPSPPTIFFPDTDETSTITFEMKKAEVHHKERLNCVTKEVTISTTPVPTASYQSSSHYLQPGKSYSMIHYEY